MTADATAPSWLSRLARPRAAVPLLLVLCLIAMLPGLRTLPAIDRDEARFAQAARQMLETGDFIDIRFQDGPRYKKPAGIYWLQALATAATGESAANPIWTYRLPSQLGAALAVLLTYALGAVLFGPAAGLLGAALLALSVLLNVEARLAKTDAVLLATAVAAQLCLARAYLAGRGAGPSCGALTAYGFWAAQGAAILIKGPVVPMFSALTAAALIVWERRSAWLLALRPSRGSALMLAIAAPWYVAITLLSDGAFWAEAMSRDLFGKVVSAQENHGAPPGYYLLLLGVTFLPGAVLMARAVPYAWQGRNRAAVRFCLAWIVPAWLLFELIPTKLPHYVLPAYPALALLCAAALGQPSAAISPRWVRWPGWALSGLALLTGVILAAAFAALAPVADARFAPAGPVAAAGAAVAITAAWRLTLRPRPLAPRGTGALVLGAVVMHGAAFGALFPGLQAPWISARLGDAVAAYDVPPQRIALAGYTEPSAVLELGTAVRLLDAKRAAAAMAAAEIDIAVIAERADPAFVGALGAAGAGVVAFERVQGFNLGKGRRVTLYLYRREGRRP